MAAGGAPRVPAFWPGLDVREAMSGSRPLTPGLVKATTVPREELFVEFPGNSMTGISVEYLKVGAGPRCFPPLGITTAPVRPLWASC